MTRTVTGLVALILIMQVATLAKTERMRLPVSSCEHRLAQFVPAPFEGVGTLPIEPISAEEFNASFDFRTE